MLGHDSCVPPVAFAFFVCARGLIFFCPFGEEKETKRDWWCVMSRDSSCITPTRADMHE